MAKAKAYGGVVFNSEGEVLLRKPAKHFGGYAWTFAKGRLDPGETPEEVALREVEEETGVKAEITGEVPGEFEGDTTITRFFLMRPIAEGKFDRETEAIRWASPEEARGLIAETPNVKGRKRDLAILEAAITAYETIDQVGTDTNGPVHPGKNRCFTPIFTISELRSFIDSNLVVDHISVDLESCSINDDAVRVRKSMDAQLFDFLGVHDGDQIIGYVEKNYLTHGTCGEHRKPFTHENLIGTRAPIVEILPLVAAKSHLFVLERTEVTQIVTRADLQKAPVRMFLFSLVTLLESTMLSLVRQIYPEESFSSRLSPSRLKKAKELLQLRIQKDEVIDLADCLQMSDKRDLLLKTPGLIGFFGWPSKPSAIQEFKDAEQLRDNLAHAQQIATGSSWQQIAVVCNWIESFIAECEKRQAEIVQQLSPSQGS